MAAPKVRADYEQLQEVASRFGSQAQAARQTLQRLQQHLDVLQGGDWLGQGANAFYNEMNSQVVPTMNRLIGALEQAADTTRQIRQIIQQAEGEAAAVFRVDGQAAAGGNGAGPFDGLGAGAAAAFVAARPGPRRSHGKAGASHAPARAEPQSFLFDLLAKEDPKLAEQVRKDRSLMLKLRMLDPEGIAVHVGHLKDPDALSQYEGGKLTLNPKHALEALTDFADQQLYGKVKLLGGLGDKLASEVKKDPVLMEQLREWDQTGVQIKLGTTAGITVFDQKSVILDPSKPLASLRDGLRRWQRSDSLPEFTLQEAQGNKDLYVQSNTERQMQADAKALLRVDAAYQKVDGEIPDTLPNGKHTAQQAEYARVVRDYLDHGSVETAIPAYHIRKLLEQEPPGNTDQRQYEAEFSRKWDQLTAAGQK